MSPGERLRYITMMRESSRPLEPLPPRLDAEWNALLLNENHSFPRKIRAVLFDIYGTLFVSGAGDISVSVADKEGEVSPSLRIFKTETVLKDSPLPPPEKVPGTFFTQAVQSRHEKARAAGIAWPEVRAEEIWAEYDGAIPPGWELPENVGSVEGMLSMSHALSLCFELAVNPVYPMPGTELLLRSLARKGYALGIISNAQWYTPFLFNAFFDAAPAELGFDPELTIYSFEEGEAKPSPNLFAKARDALARKNIAPEETLYVGNDMRNDILPAADAGFVTALFAGDRRSLRFREDELRAEGRAGAKPDCVAGSLGVLEKALVKTDT